MIEHNLPCPAKHILDAERKTAMRQMTKQAITDAFHALLIKRSIEKITVKDIVTECGLNRQTFYYHFHDIYDLMEWSLTREIEKCVEESVASGEDEQGQIRQLFHLFYTNRIIILHGYDAKNRMQYERAVIKPVYKLMRERIETYPQAEKVPEEKKDFIAKVYARGCAGLILEWIEEGMPDERRVQLDDYFVIIDGSMNHALDKFKL